MLTEDLKRLSNAEKLLLISDLWDDIADSVSDIPLSNSTAMLLDERFAAYRSNPDDGRDWEDVKSEIRDNL